MRFQPPWRKIGLVCMCVATGTGILVLHGLVFSDVLPAPGEYFLTDLASAQLGMLSVTIGFLLAMAIGFSWQIPAPVVGLSMVAIFPLVAIYEGTVFPGSHNLLPFELVIFALCSLPLMVAAALGRWAARRMGRDDVWSKTAAVTGNPEG